jgi:hypothetical protein
MQQIILVLVVIAGLVLAVAPVADPTVPVSDQLEADAKPGKPAAMAVLICEVRPASSWDQGFDATAEP